MNQKSEMDQQSEIRDVPGVSLTHGSRLSDQNVIVLHLFKVKLKFPFIRHGSSRHVKKVRKDHVKNKDLFFRLKGNSCINIKVHARLCPNYSKRHNSKLIEHAAFYVL